MEFTWPVTVSILGVLGTLCVAMVQFGPDRRNRKGANMSMDMNMEPAQEIRLENRLEKISQDMVNMEVEVRSLKSEQGRQAVDVTEVRQSVQRLETKLDNNLEAIRRLIADIRTEHGV